MITAQNLVPNGDFEQYRGCPDFEGELDSAQDWINPTTYIFAADYYNPCALTPNERVPNNSFGYQIAHSGVGYAGIFLLQLPLPETREYMEVKLISPLLADSCYHFKMFVNLGNKCSITSHNIGVYFSDTIISGLPDITQLPYIPQIQNTTGNTFDTLNWTKVSGDYTAIGGENYLIIGNYNSDISTDTAEINPSGISGWIYVYIDDVSLVPCSTTGITNYTNTPEINIFPNPITTQLTININNNEPTELTLYDITSRKILQQTFVASATINTESLAEGIYLYQLKTSKGIIKEGKVVK